jgi:hypothetical protein
LNPHPAWHVEHHHAPPQRAHYRRGHLVARRHVDDVIALLRDQYERALPSGG